MARPRKPRRRRGGRRPSAAPAARPDLTIPAVPGPPGGRHRDGDDLAPAGPWAPGEVPLAADAALNVVMHGRHRDAIWHGHNGMADEALAAGVAAGTIAIALDPAGALRIQPTVRLMTEAGFTRTPDGGWAKPGE